MQRADTAQSSPSSAKPPTVSAAGCKQLKALHDAQKLHALHRAVKREALTGGDLRRQASGRDKRAEGRQQNAPPSHSRL